MSALRWIPRAQPLPAEGVVGVGAVARALGCRLLERGALSCFQGVAGDGLLVLLGEAPPWVDGVTYLGREPESPGLWLPTHTRPHLHPALLGRHLSASGLRGPVLLLPGDGLMVALGAARAVDEGRLRAWLS